MTFGPMTNDVRDTAGAIQKWRWVLWVSLKDLMFFVDELPPPSGSDGPDGSVGGWEGPAPCVLVPPAVWCPPAAPPRCCVPPCVWWACAPCAAPPCGGFLPRVLVPPCGVVAPTKTIAMTAERLQR